MASGFVMSAEPLISVAMCTYNGEKYLAEQLESILCQTYRNIEVVVFDDASTDSSVDILKKYQQKDARLRVFENVKNVGFIANFQQALLACNGSYIALADQDDIWFANKLQSLYRDIGDSQLVYSAVTMIDKNGVPIAERFPRVKRIEGACALSLIFDNCVTGHACLIRRELLAMALPMPLGVFSHDQWLAIVAASDGRMKAGGEVLSYYRKHGENTLLSQKGRQAISKREKNESKVQRIISLIDFMLCSGLFELREVALLEKLKSLLLQNRGMLYNWQLAAFLKEHQDKFLSLYSNKRKVIKKICRGSWYFRLIPFS